MAASTTALVPLEDYLHTNSKPGHEWVDGQLRQRSMPDGYHGCFQQFFIVWIHALGGLHALPETRIRTSPRSYRIPDVLVLPDHMKFLPDPVEPPLICIEILSPDDRLSDLQEKVEDYIGMGVAAVWIVDPRRRRMSLANASGIHPVQQFTVPRRPETLLADELFAGLDTAEALQA